MNRFNIMTDEQLQRVLSNQKGGSAVLDSLLIPQVQELEKKMKKVLGGKKEDSFMKFKQLQRRLNALYKRLSHTPDDLPPIPTVRTQPLTETNLVEQNTPKAERKIIIPQRILGKSNETLQSPPRKRIKQTRIPSAVRSTGGMRRTLTKRPFTPNPNFVSPRRTRSKIPKPVVWQTIEGARQKDKRLARI